MAERRSIAWRAALFGLLAGLCGVAAAQTEAPAQESGPADEAAPPEADAAPPPEADYSLEAVVERMRESRRLTEDRLAAREARYEERLAEAERELAEAQATLAAKEAEGERLENRFDANKVELSDKAALLKDKIGALKELFGVFQQNASDLIGAFNGSPTSLQYPDRDVWLEGFANRMKNASEVSSADDIKVLWYEMLREIAATGDIVRLSAPVMGPEGRGETRDLVRVGTFNLISDAPAYLAWDAGRQQVVELERQPAGPYLDEIRNYLATDEGMATLSVDPTGGVLLSLLIEKPTLSERIDQGGLVGYLILGLGALSLLLALLKLIDISLISLRVGLQQRDLSKPLPGNALGRLLLTWREHRGSDSEILEMRLHDRVSKETSRIHAFTIFLAIIAAVAPLMGLLGTVVGMINTFQAITLYGTGDPQTMAGGISQALITTVLGLTVAVPAVLLHAALRARGNSLVNLLKQQSAALTGDAMAAPSSGNGAEPPTPHSSPLTPHGSPA